MESKHALKMASDSGFEEFHSASRGRGIRAKVSFEPGSNILACDPYLFISRGELHGKICDGCLTVKSGLRRCSFCKSVYYCGQNCQRMAWNIHKVECKYLKKIFPKIPGDTVRLMALLLSRSIDTDGDFIQNLASHCDEVRKEKSEMFAYILTMLHKYFGIGEETSKEMIFQLFCKVHCNTFTISDGELKPVGLALYRTASFINHSCLPNCVAVFIGARCYIQAIDNIKAGDELCISYTELMRPCRIRRKELREQYFFECGCACCKREETFGTAMNGLKCSNKQCSNVVGLLSDDIEQTCSTCGSQISSIYSPSFISNLHDKIDMTLSSVDDALAHPETQRKALDICERLLEDVEEMLHPMNYQVLKIVNKASDICIQMSLWNKALHYCKKSLIGYQKFYPKHHPSIGLQLYMIGKLELHLDALDPGLQSLCEAKNVLDICYGEVHPLTQELDELLFKTAREKQFLSDVPPISMLPME